MCLTTGEMEKLEVKQFHFYNIVVHGAICRSRNEQSREKKFLYQICRSESILSSTSVVHIPHLSFRLDILSFTCRSHIHNSRSPVVQISTNLVHLSFRSPQLSFTFRGKNSLSFQAPTTSFQSETVSYPGSVPFSIT